MALFFKVNYTTHVERAAKSVRYHAFRSRELPDESRGVFDRNRDAADIKAFIDRLDDPLTRHPRAATMHRLMFSVSRGEWQRLGLTDWKPIMREALSNYEQKSGKRLDWVAAAHNVEGNGVKHPHVHVDVKSVYWDANGKPHRWRVDGRERELLRREVDRVLDRHREQYRRRFEAVRETETMIKGFGGILKAMLRSMEHAHKEQEIRQRGIERDRQRERGT